MESRVAGTSTQDEAGPSRTETEERAETVTLMLVPRKKPKKKIKWSEDTVDNENMGRKKSKKCCIFHKKKRFDESSDESSSEDSDAEHLCDDENCNDINCVGKPLDFLKLKAESDRLRDARAAAQQN
ncbi:protein phosphatase inhibitor [Chloropicon primus]|uniref:Protein phosphatase inhibitor n=1 Tax=Chloropicon primus TaxID=1764295 RepID=A0A5B8MXW0_9CHLO|nr:protein phosphatase inhibitor [Chloropicon primus]UPR04386.1 protein phosphatase inhibitor [Chloropicon primus]|mmetsp:Transcript_11987/g.33164  ORF Transcript_11987/g.33164 Transcript_11987/m.33164 type:complete len:127 (-) Transcript_11987:957-1337(-)|eukprot:QDZ25181.1 protein phosphatase inhibitor [Chloropicon primus]